MAAEQAAEQPHFQTAHGGGGDELAGGMTVHHRHQAEQQHRGDGEEDTISTNGSRYDRTFNIVAELDDRVEMPIARVTLLDKMFFLEI